jgi:hypothetical protein
MQIVRSIGGTDLLGENPVPMPMCPPLSNTRALDKTRIFVVRGQQLTTRAMTGLLATIINFNYT